MTRPPDPPGVAYEGSDGFYKVLLHGNWIGTVVKNFSTFTATPRHDKGWAWTAPTRRQAVEQLIAWREQQS